MNLEKRKETIRQTIYRHSIATSLIVIVEIGNHYFQTHTKNFPTNAMLLVAMQSFAEFASMHQTTEKKIMFCTK